MADEKNLVEINAKVVLDEKSLEKIKTKLSNINDIKLKLGIDKSYFDNAIKEVKDKYNNQTGPHIKLKVGATFKELTDSIRNIANRADIANKKIKIGVGADLSSFDKTLGSLGNKGKDVKVKVGVDADTTKAISSIESINNKLNALKENKVAVGLDTSKALSEVDKLKDALKGFTSSKGAYATVKVSGDTRSASTHIQNLQAKIDKLKKDSEKALNLEVNVKNQKGLHNVVQNIRAHLEKIFSKEYYVKVNNRDAIVSIKKIDTALNTLKSNANMHVSATTNAKDGDVKVLQDLAGALKTLNSVYKKADNGTWKFNIDFAKTGSTRVDSVTAKLEDLARVMEKINTKHDVNLDAKPTLPLIAKEVNQIANDLERIGKGRTIKIDSGRERLGRRPTEGYTDDDELNKLIDKRNNFLARAEQALASGKTGYAKRWNTLADNITPDLERQLDNRKNAINASTVDVEKLKDKLKDLPKIDIPVEFAGIKELERRLSIIRGLIKGINNTTVNVKTNGAVPKRSGSGGGRSSGGGSFNSTEPGNMTTAGGFSYLTRFLGRSTKGTGSFSEALAQMTTDLERAHGGASRLATGLGAMSLAFSVVTAGATAFVGIMEGLCRALGAIGNVIVTALTPGWETMTAMQSGTLSLQAALKGMSTVEGKAVTSAQAHAGAIGLVNKAMMDAQKSAFSFNELMEAMSGTMPIFLGKGMTADQAYSVTKGVAAVAKVHNLAPHQVIQESRDIAQGSITAGHSQVANALGITNDDIKKYEGDADGLVKFLEGKFKEYNDILEEYSNTPKGAFDQFMDTLGIAGAKILETFGEPIIAVFKTLTDLMGSFNEQTGEFELSPALSEFGSYLEEIVLHIASCIDTLINFAMVVTETNDPVEAFVAVIEWLIDAVTTTIGTTMSLINILGYVGRYVRMVGMIIINVLGMAISVVQALANSFIALWKAANGDMSGAKEALNAVKSNFSEAHNDALSHFDFEGMWKNNQSGTTYAKLFGTENYDKTTYMGVKGRAYNLILEALNKQKNREKKDVNPANASNFKGKYNDSGSDKKKNKEVEKANRQAIKESQQALKEHREAIKNILEDTLDRLKDLLEENEISYKEGFTSIKEYYERKADLEKQEAEARLNAAKEELEAINNSKFNNEYEKLSAQHKVEREIAKYSKQLGKAQQAQVEVSKAVGQYTQAMGTMQASMMNNMLDIANILHAGVNGGSNGGVGTPAPTTGDKLTDLAIAVTEEFFHQTGKKINPGYVWGLLADETGRGTSKVFQADNNPGGITWTPAWGRDGYQKGSARPSNEGGYYVHFNDLSQAAKGQAEVLAQGRYSGIVGAESAQAFLNALKSGGYMATDNPSALANYVSLMNEGVSKFSQLGITVDSIISGSTSTVNKFSSSVNNLGNSVNSTLNQTFSQLVNKEMPHLTKGCVEAVVRLGAGFSEVLQNELANNVASIHTLEADLKAAGVQIDTDTSTLQPGDILVVNGGGHVVMVQDAQHTVGNSSYNNPNTPSGSGIMQQDLSYWKARTNRVIRTGSIGLKSGFAPGNMNLLAANKTKLGSEAFEAMQKALADYRALIDDINSDIFGAVPDVESQLHSLYEEKAKLQHSNDALDRKKLDAVIKRIEQKSTKIMSDFFIDMLEFNMSRIESTAKYRATEIAYGKNSAYDTSFADMVKKYNSYFNNVIDIVPIQARQKKLAEIRNIYANPTAYHDDYMKVNDEEWEKKNHKDTKPIWDAYTSKLNTFDELRDGLYEMLKKTVDSVDIKQYNIENRKKLEELASNTDDTGLKSAIENFYKYNDDFWKWLMDSKRNPIITRIAALEKVHNDNKKYIKDNNIDFRAIRAVANAYHEWKKVNDELWDMQNVEGKKGTPAQIKAKTEEFNKLLADYNHKQENTDRYVKQLDMELAMLQTQLNLAKQTPANQIALLTKEFARYTRLGNVKAADNVRKKILEARDKLFSIVDSWIGEVSNKYDTVQSYFDAVPATNLQRERGNAELKSYKNAELAEHYRSALTTLKGNYQDTAEKIYANKKRQEFLKARNLAIPSTSSEYKNNKEEIQELIAERELLVEQQRNVLGKLDNIQHKMLIAEELSRYPSLLNDIRDTSKQALEDGLVTFLTDGVTEAKNLSDALRTLALDFIKTMQKMFANRLVTDLMQSWFPAKTHEGERTNVDGMSKGISNIATREVVTSENKPVVNGASVEFPKLKTLDVRNKDKLTFNMTQEGEIDTSKGGMLATYKGYNNEPYIGKDKNYDFLNKDNDYKVEAPTFKQGAYEYRLLSSDELKTNLDNNITPINTDVKVDTKEATTLDAQQQVANNTSQMLTVLRSIDNAVNNKNTVTNTSKAPTDVKVTNAKSISPNANTKAVNDSLEKVASSAESASIANKSFAVSSTGAASSAQSVTMANQTAATATSQKTTSEMASTVTTDMHKSAIISDTNAIQQHIASTNMASQNATMTGGMMGAGALGAIGGVPYGMQTGGVGATLGNGLSSVLQPVTNLVSRLTNQLASFLNSGVFTSLMNSVTSITGSAGAQLGGSVLAIGSLINGDKKEQLLSTIFLELQLIYFQIMQLNNQIKLIGMSMTSATNSAYATGGKITGPGTGTSDSIPAMLSNGEYVVKASAVRKYGTGFLNAVNNGNFAKLHMPIARFADGGSVLKEASDSTSRGVESFANNIGTNISNTNNISIGLVRDDDAIIANFLHSSKGQKYLLDFNRKNAKIINTF